MPKQPSTFHIINLGCKVNRVEADSMIARLLSAGANQSVLSEADVVVINTCTVTSEADVKSRKVLRLALRQAPQATVIVCGCGAATDPAQFKDDSDKHLVIANKEAALYKAAEILGLEIPQHTKAVARVGEDFHTRVAIKVQDGCDHACSYCIVPQARGPAQSLPTEQVLAEIATQTQAGAREIVLTGIDLGSYQDGAQGLEFLLNNALSQGNNYRLRLSSIELPRITDELIELIAVQSGRICAHLHIPLQSGSDSILSVMRRQYDVAMYKAKIDQIKAALPQVAISTDVIVGFPGETEEDFCQTLSLCKEVGFSRVHIFRYSKRPGTIAADLPGHIAAGELTERASRLRSLATQLTAEDAQSRIGSTEAMVFEGVHRGRSESYYVVRIAKSVTRGNMATMKITGSEQGELIAEECEES